MNGYGLGEEHCGDRTYHVSHAWLAGDWTSEHFAWCRGYVVNETVGDTGWT